LECRVKSGCIPSLGEFSPAAVASVAFALIQLAKELLVPERFTMLLGVLEDVVGQVHAWKRRSRVKLHYMIDVAAQDGGLQVASADHVVGHEEELLSLHPFVLGAHLG
jgi:hypothetical protein